VLLIDQRYGSEHYRALLPEGWNLVRIHHNDQLAAELQRFW
jgi:hypothetical protein